MWHNERGSSDSFLSIALLLFLLAFFAGCYKPRIVVTHTNGAPPDTIGVEYVQGGTE